MTSVLVLARSPNSGRTSVLVPELVARLRSRGCSVDLLDPDRAAHDLSRVDATYDLVVLKSGTEAALSWAGALEAAGQRVVNPHAVAAACRDKIVQTGVLLRAGLPVPTSWLVCDPTSLAGELDTGPLILKDPRGSQGRGLAVVHSKEELAVLRRERPWLGMRYHAPDGADLKLYRIGEEVFGVERPFPATSYAEKTGRIVDVPPDLREVLMRCGEAFGITVYGVDVIRSGGVPWLVDMSAFPGFKGVPDAGSRIADHLLEAS